MPKAKICVVYGGANFSVITERCEWQGVSLMVKVKFLSK